VGPFLFNLFSDPEIIRIPSFFARPLAWFISTRRTNISRELPANWGGSPLRQITEAQAHALQEGQQKDKARIYVGMRYWHPFTEEAIARINVTALNAW